MRPRWDSPFVRSLRGASLGFEAVSLCIQLLFEQTTADRIVAITDARNTPSIRLLERIQMQRVKVVDTVFRGSPCVEYVYSFPRKSDAAILTTKQVI